MAPQNGVVRVSMVHYNTIDEVDRLIAALDPVLQDLVAVGSEQHDAS